MSAVSIRSTVSAWPTTALPISARMRSASVFTSLTFTRHLHSPAVKAPGKGGESGAVTHSVGVGGQRRQGFGAVLAPNPIEEVGQRLAGQVARRPDGAGGRRPRERGIA